MWGEGTGGGSQTHHGPHEVLSPSPCFGHSGQAGGPSLSPSLPSPPPAMTSAKEGKAAPPLLPPPSGAEERRRSPLDQLPPPANSNKPLTPFSIEDILNKPCGRRAPSARLLDKVACSPAAPRNGVVPAPASPLCALQELASKTFKGLEVNVLQAAEGNGPELLRRRLGLGEGGVPLAGSGMLVSLGPVAAPTFGTGQTPPREIPLKFPTKSRVRVGVEGRRKVESVLPNPAPRLGRPSLTTNSIGGEEKGAADRRESGVAAVRGGGGGGGRGGGDRIRVFGFSDGGRAGDESKGLRGKRGERRSGETGGCPLHAAPCRGKAAKSGGGGGPFLGKASAGKALCGFARLSEGALPRCLAWPGAVIGGARGGEGAPGVCTLLAGVAGKGGAVVPLALGTQAGQRSKPRR